MEVLFGAPAESRTPDNLIKSQVLYQLSYRGVFGTKDIIAQYFNNVKSKIKKIKKNAAQRAALNSFISFLRFSSSERYPREQGNHRRERRGRLPRRFPQLLPQPFLPC